MQIPQQAIDIIKKFEGFETRTYLDPVGIPTIGYGTTAAANVGIVPVPGMAISERQATEYLRRAVEKFAKRIERHITVPINENEWAAFLSIAYNIGPGAFAESTFLRKFNDGDKIGCADAMLWWDKAGGKTLRGLTRRRQHERTLFLTPVQPVSWAAWLLDLLRFWK